MRTGERLRADIVEAAERLLGEHGAGALTTRAVAGEAGVQPPTIYRLFGDKDGLIDAVAEHVMATYVAEKAARMGETAPGADPVGELRDAWQRHIEFGLSNPDLYALINAPGRGASAATAAGIDLLRAHVHQIAAAGLLRVDEQRAVDMIHAAGSGVVLALLQAPPAERDLRLPDAVLDAVVGAILAAPTAPADAALTTVALSLRARLPELPALSDAERALMNEWLTRAITQLDAA